MDFIIRQGQEKDLPALAARLPFNQCRIVRKCFVYHLVDGPDGIEAKFNVIYINARKMKGLYECHCLLQLH